MFNLIKALQLEHSPCRNCTQQKDFLLYGKALKGFPSAAPSEGWDKPSKPDPQPKGNKSGINFALFSFPALSVHKLLPIAPH